MKSINVKKKSLYEESYRLVKGQNRFGKSTPNNHNSSANAHVSVYFRGIEKEIIKRIKRYPVVCGCVAWLSDFDVIDALSKNNKRVSIVVQKEDFLRPDGEDSGFKERLKNAYEKVPHLFHRHKLPESCVSVQAALSGYGDGDLLDPRRDMSSHIWPSLREKPNYVHPFRCAGRYIPLEKSFPRMHNKFLVFCDVGTDGVYNDHYIPREVWTGSYNMSATARLGFENGVAIKSEKLALAYAQEYSEILMLSEPLNWVNDWVDPEYTWGCS